MGNARTLYYASEKRVTDLESAGEALIVDRAQLGCPVLSPTSVREHASSDF